MMRPARRGDEAGVQALVRDCLLELGLPFDLAGLDDDLSELETHYPAPDHAFTLLEEAGRIVGTVGIARLDATTCELKRLYLDRTLRGRGLGRALLDAALDFARAAGYRRVELDTHHVMKQAARLYEARGFRPLPLDPGCCYCDLRYYLDLPAGTGTGRA